MNEKLKGGEIALEAGRHFEKKYGTKDSIELLLPVLAVSTYAATHPKRAVEVLNDVIEVLTKLRDNAPSQLAKGIGKN